jgi:SMI1 / KNR4 family (SUKH-1)
VASIKAMSKIENIETHFGFSFPKDYKDFFLEAHNFVLDNSVYCRVLQNGYKTDGLVFEFHTIDNFVEKQECRDYLIEFQTHFENPIDYVEAEHLYHIADGTGSVCISLAGQHYGKIFSVDNGDFGIIYQAENIKGFVDSLYEPSKFGCEYEELIEAVRNNNLTLLSELVENRDGNKLIEYSSSLDIELLDIAYDKKFDNILKYLISKGYKGYNRVERYKLQY